MWGRGTPICRHYPITSTGSTTAEWGVLRPRGGKTAAGVASRAVRAATIRDGEIAVQEHPDPTPQAGELLVRVHAAGLNGADMMQLKGLYPAPPGAPSDIPGLELAGEVVGVGDGVQRFEVGDRVMAIVGGGGQGELAVVHERVAMPIPEELDWTAAGGVPEVFCTAHDALFTQAGLTVGERLLVHGAAGGVGMAAVQLGTMAGARVTATVRDEHCRERIAALGVNALAPDEFVEAGPFDVILELVGAPNFPANFQALAPRGRIGVVGIGAGAQIDLSLRDLMYKRVRMFGTVMRARSLEEKAVMTRDVEKSVLPGFASGDLAVPVTASYPLDDVAAAYERFQAGGKLGKIVLEM
jgi:NADPH2:quinone reductase